MLMWTNYIKWRKENNVDDILKTYECPKLAELIEVYPHGYHKTCKLGRTIYIDRIGMTDLDTINTVLTNDELVMHNIHSYEELILHKMHALSILQQKRLDQCTNIMDLTGFGLSKMTKKTWALVQLMSGVA